MNLSEINCLIFDLDDTLYSQDCGAWDMIHDRIQSFMIEELHFPTDIVPELRTRLYQQYGTTLRGLQTEYTVDMDAFLEYVHAVPLENALKPNPSMAHMLENLPQRKVVFTNSTAYHANRVLNLLGVSDLFEDIIDIYVIAPHCKPEVEAFEIALNRIDEEPTTCLLIDDSVKNLKTAISLGMKTVGVGNTLHDGSPHIENIMQLPKVFFPDLIP